MKCARPVKAAYRTVPCGQCMNCRINKRRKKATRLMLEMRCHHISSFITLTYDEDHVPIEYIDGEYVRVLSKKDARAFQKALRYRLGTGLRMFFIGEYGDTTWRPHYHLALFGQDPLLLNHTEVIEACWTKGGNHIAELNGKLARYIAHYTTKKLTRQVNVLGNRVPEFAWHPREPALGVPYLQQLIDWHHTPEGAAEIARTGDVVRQVNIGRKPYPLDEYMLRALREALDIPVLARDRVPGWEEPEELDAEEAAAVQAEAVSAEAKHYRRARQRGTL